MLNTIFTKNLKSNTLKNLTSIACFATISKKSQASSSIEKGLKAKSVVNKKNLDTIPKTAKNQTSKSQTAGTLLKQSLLDAPYYKSKAHFIKKLLVLIKLKKTLSQSPATNTRHIDEITAKTFSQNNKNPVENNEQNLKSQSLEKLQITLLDIPETIPRQGVKPFSTVTGFKKFMYNFVKLSQSQLQPGYNRRKYSHSHYNQTLKESTRLSRFYAYLPKNLMKNLCGFAINPALVKTSFEKDPHTLTINRKPFALYDKVSDKLNVNLSPGYFLRSTLKNRGQFTKQQEFTDKHVHKPFNAEKYAGVKVANHVIRFHRPIPKMVNYLESRLDVILWRNQLVSSIKSARQKLRQGIKLNKGLQKTASYQTLPGDVFTFDK